MDPFKTLRRHARRMALRNPSKYAKVRRQRVRQLMQGGNTEADAYAILREEEAQAGIRWEGADGTP